jgi:hypothetical protein
MKRAEMEAGAAKDIAALEAKHADMDAHAAENSIIAKRHFEDFGMKLARDLAPMRKAYECNIRSLNRICSPVPDAAPSAKDYVRWLKSELDFLPQVCTGLNENFISVAIDGMLTSRKIIYNDTDFFMVPINDFNRY